MPVAAVRLYDSIRTALMVDHVTESPFRIAERTHSF